MSASLVENLKTNPVVVIAVLVAVGIKAGAYTVDDVSAFFATVASVIVIVSGFVARQFVTPVSRADARAAQAYKDVEVEDHPGNPFAARQVP